MSEDPDESADPPAAEAAEAGGKHRASDDPSESPPVAEEPSDSDIDPAVRSARGQDEAETLGQPEPGPAGPSRAELSAAYVSGRRQPTGKSEGLGESESLDDVTEFRRASDRDFQRFASQVSSNNGIFSSGDNTTAVQQQVTVVVNEARQISVLRSTYTDDTVRQMTEAYVPTAEYAQIVDVLMRRSVVVLQGADGSGRRATAVYALHDLSMGPISVLDVDQSVQLRDIADKKLFERSGAYVLDHSLALEDNTVDVLADLARKARSLLVIVAHGDAVSSPLAVARPHTAPAAEEVLRRQLKVQLDRHRCPNCAKAEGADAYIQRRLGEIAAIERYTLPAKMREVTDLARIFVDNVHSEVPTSSLVERDRASLRRIAGEAMRTGPEKTDGAERWQSFRLAYAVFDGFPLRLVFEAAEMLAREVLPLYEKRDSPPEHVVFEGAVAELLHEPMYIADPIEQLAEPGSVPRCARLVDPALTGMILDVVWNDFDSVHLPLLTWLDMLAGQRNPYVRVRAAQSAALLAAFDFDQVYRTLIRPWAERGLAYRQSAAAALQLAAADDRLAGRVRRQVNDWARSPNPQLQDSAARALSTTIGATDPIGAVDKLRDLAGRPDLAVSSAIGAAMVSLFGANAAALVLDELAAWATGHNVHRKRHAVRAVLLLTRAAGPEGAGGWPSVHLLIGTDELRLRTLVHLWSYALISPDTAGLAWEPLRRWLLSADENGNLSAFVVDLASRILREVGPSRSLFHLGLWRRRYAESAAIADVYESMRKAS